jgi:predicted transcriptional regulator of viral defense system
MTEKTIPAGRARLAAVIGAAGDVVRIDDAVQALDISRTQAAKLLSRWAGQGWLRRVGTGAYVPVQLEMVGAAQVVQDPWVLVPTLFAPAYIGGRTAAEHWDLTEQIFRDIVVFTARPLRKKTVERQGALFTLANIGEERLFGTKAVWRSQTKIAISDIHRTIIDMLDDPATGGGIQHVADCLERYLQRSDSDPATLIAYAERLGNGAVFKRLGFLAERHHGDGPLAQACKDRLTKGHALLDPALNCERLVTRWRLRVPQTWTMKRGGS